MRYANCEQALRVLAAGMDEVACHDFEAIRQIAACRAWQTWEEEQVGTFGSHMHRAWNQIKQGCQSYGGDKPETGFLEGIRKREEPGECPVCPAILAAHCTLHGQENPDFCALLERYYVEPTLTTDDLMVELSRIATPQQMKEAGAAVNAQLARVGVQAAPVG